MMKRNCRLKIIMCDAGASGLHSHAGAWERGNVYLASAELAAVAVKLGKLPTVAEYMQNVEKIAPLSQNIYRYLNFHQIASYQAVANDVKSGKIVNVAVVAA